jgi:hypothetical protein
MILRTAIVPMVSYYHELVIGENKPLLVSKMIGLLLCYFV